jgi:hypothetical protein
MRGSIDSTATSSQGTDRRSLAKMLKLDARLGAKVQGDDGERYESPEDL